jgi:hypothetical protein
MEHEVLGRWIKDPRQRGMGWKKGQQSGCKKMPETGLA